MRLRSGTAPARLVQCGCLWGPTGYINGEMAVIDGGAQLRSSGAEDPLRWTDAQWADQRAARTKS